MRAPRAIDEGAAGTTIAEAFPQDATCNAGYGSNRTPLSFMDVKLSPRALNVLVVPQNS
jgi:hypothetical protein